MAVGLASQCVLVDGSLACVNGQILVDSWNGTSWAIDTVPDENATDSLIGVSCIATTSDCVAIGGYYDYSTDTVKTLVDSWDGTAWTVTYGPSPTWPFSAGFEAISCAGFASCVTVGASQGTSPSVHNLTLAASWDGTALSLIPPNNPSPSSDGLNSISCISSTDCVAVGSFNPHSQPLIEVWNGTAWSVVPTAPAFTSSPRTTFLKGKNGTFTVRATGYPMRMHFTKTGSLPSGVTLSSSGVLSGTPATTGTYPLTVTASNGVLRNATQHFTLTVAIIEITTRTLGDPFPGVPYSLQLTEEGGVAPFTWANTTPKLPAGLALSASGKVTGTVKYTVTSGAYSVGISLHDNALPTHHYATATLTIFVE